MTLEEIYYELRECMKDKNYYKFASKLPNDIYFDDNFILYEEYYKELCYFNDSIYYDDDLIITSCNKLLSILLKVIKIKEHKYD